MAQNYDPTLPASGQTTFGELYQILRDKFEALRSSFSGTSFPINPVAGQVCFRTDRGKWYIYSNDPSIGESGWVEIAIAASGSIGEEVINARGSKSSLDERLDVSLNEDGTLKANVAAYQSEWIKPSLTFTYVDATTFRVEGDQTDIYVPYRRVKINHSTSPTGYTTVVSSSYDSAVDITTVQVADAVIQSDLVSVEHGIITADRTRDSLPRNIDADKVDGFDASQTPAPNTIPVADANGKLDNWIPQGSGSGLDADKLDGLDSSAFARVNGDNTQRFKVADAVEPDEAVNKAQLESKLKPNVTYLSKSGHNSQAILVDGKLYQANGKTGSYSAHTTGVYNNGANAKFGVMNGWNNITYPSSSPIKKVGGFFRDYAFILTEDGELFTFGYNSNGQLGLGHTTATIEPTLAATDVIDVYTHPSQCEYNVNGNRLFILKPDGLYGCGYNGYGQVGVGNTTASITTFTKCTGLPNTSASDILKVFPIGNAYGSTWVLTSDGRLWVTGRNNTGWHGDGTTSDKNTFVDVTSYWVTPGKTLADVKITGGSRYYDSSGHGSQGVVVMLLKYTDGTSEVKAAGYNAWGSLGNGTTTSSSTPVSPIGLPTDGSIIDIAGFGGPPLTVLALSSNGDLWAWGYNSYGQCGDGTTTNKLTPEIVTTGVIKLFSDGMTSHNSGYRTQSLVKKSDGLYMAGYNDGNYYAGMGVTVTGNVTTFSKVKLPEDDNDVIDIGHFTTKNHNRIFLALTSKGNIYTWGYNGNNGIHTDNTNNVPIPQLINIPRRND